MEVSDLVGVNVFFPHPLASRSSFGIAGCLKVASKLPTKSTRFFRFAIFDFKGFAMDFRDVFHSSVSVSSGFCSR